jgi:hypothetical protein
MILYWTGMFVWQFAFAHHPGIGPSQDFTLGQVRQPNSGQRLY